VSREEHDRVSDELATMRAEVQELQQAGIPTQQELGAEAQELFAAVVAALEQGDTDSFYSLLAPDVRAACTVEQVGAAIEGGEVLFPDLKVGDVYLNVNDGNRAFVQVGLRDAPEGIEGLATTIAVAFPWAIVMEG